MPRTETEDCGCIYVDDGMYYRLKKACEAHQLKEDDADES